MTDAIIRSNAISRSAALSMMDEYIDMARDDEIHHAMCVVAEGLAELPTLDAVPVVRCKDCKHWKPCAGATEHVKCCEFAGYMVGENGYCVYGEAKEHD